MIISLAPKSIFSNFSRLPWMPSVWTAWWRRPRRWGSWTQRRRGPRGRRWTRYWDSWRPWRRWGYFIEVYKDNASHVYMYSYRESHLGWQFDKERKTEGERPIKVWSSVIRRNGWVLIENHYVAFMNCRFFPLRNRWRSLWCATPSSTSTTWTSWRTRSDSWAYFFLFIS